MLYRLLGPLEVIGDDGDPVVLGGERERVLLATLLLHVNHVVGTDRLVDALWGDEPPHTAANALQVHISKLRKKLAAASSVASPVESAAPGYVMRTAQGELDIERFEELIRAETDHAETAARLSEALSLWRGPALADVSSEALRGDKARLDELRQVTLERRIEADLALGRHLDLVPELESLVHQEPLREGPRRQLMLALYRAGRQVDALSVYREGRELLAEQLGIDPGPELQDLELAILQQAPRLAAPARTSGSTPELPSGTVTFLCTAIEGSTTLWDRFPEEMGSVVPRVEQILCAEIAGAEGVVFRSAGDEVSAVFSSVDQAIDACASIQQALRREAWPASLGLGVAMAIHTGGCEARNGDYYGPVVNRASGLAAIAHGGQVLLSSASAGLTGKGTPRGTALVDVGEHRLRDLGQPEHVYQLEIEGLASDFPPLRSLANPTLQNNLPGWLSTLIGRDRELGEIRRLLERCRLVTLVGAGGCGKTRLALQVAAAMLDGSGSGVWFVDLAPLLDSGLVLGEVASTLSVREEPGRSLQETLVAALRDRYLLMVLDNCEHVIDVCAKVADSFLRHCPRVYMLATSREPLAIDAETVYKVAPLAVPAPSIDPALAASFEAVQLFAARAAAQNQDFVLDVTTAGAVASLCRHLDGIPLAIELAAARVRSMSLADLEARLTDRFRLLTTGSRTALPHHQTLRALIGWSYDLLNYEERAVFNRLSVFAGGFDLETAEAICSSAAVPDWRVTDALSSLVDKSLVQTDKAGSSVRYRLLETIGAYAAERLAEDRGTEVETYASHASWFLGLAERAKTERHGPLRSEWLERLETEHDNLLRAHFWLMASSVTAADAFRLADALSWFWSGRGHLIEGLQAMNAVLAMPTADVPSELRCWVLNDCGWLHFHRAELAQAKACADEGLTLAHLLVDPELIAENMELLYAVAWESGDETAAGELAMEALPFARQSDSPRLIARLLEDVAFTMADRDGLEARAHMEEALLYFRETGDDSALATALTNFGDFELQTGHPEQARQLLEEALTVSGDCSDYDLQLIHCNLFLATLLMRDVTGAARYAAEALSVSAGVEHSLMLWAVMLNAALCASALEKHEQAARLHGALESILVTRGSEPPNRLEPRLRDEDRSRLRSILGGGVFDAAFRSGRSLTTEEAVQLARDAVLANDSSASVEPPSLAPG